MKKDNKNRRKAALGAVIAAGVTTGAMALSAGNSANALNAEMPEPGLTAADMVMIDGQEVTVDDMASPDKNHRDKKPKNQKKTMYGPRPRVYGPRPPKPTPEQQEKIDSAQVAREVIAIVSVAMHLDVDVTIDSRFIEDLGADSLDIVEIVMDVEKKFNIIIPNEKLEELTTVGQLIQFVREEKKNKNDDIIEYEQR